MPSVSTRRLAVPAVAIGMAAALTAGCSGSSSSGGPTSPQVTAAAVGAETFPGITKHVNHELQRVVPTMRGVRSTTYDSAQRTLRVYFTSDAVKLDQHNVENIVTQARNGQLQPTPSATASGSATPGHSPREHHKKGKKGATKR